MSEYDSAEDTKAHIRCVAHYLEAVVHELCLRGGRHDASKLRPPEKEAFDRCTPKLKATVYGTPEYKEACRELGPALKHHYENNPHHPEFHVDGVCGMSLLDLIEMLCDWKAAGERHADGGDMMRSLDINAGRHNMPDAIRDVLQKTIEEMGWREPTS